MTHTPSPESRGHEPAAPDCGMCDDTGHKDHAGFAMDPCNHQRPTPAAGTLMSCTREDAISFLETAARNWRRFPSLSEDDLADVAGALTAFLGKHTRQPTPAVEDVVEAVWEALKAECCADPSKATKCVMVGKEQLAATLQARPAELPQDHWTVKALIKAGNALSVMAQTTGGTAGPDGALMAAIDQWSSVRKIVELEGGDPAISAGRPAEPAGEEPVELPDGDPDHTDCDGPDGGGRFADPARVSRPATPSNPDRLVAPNA